MINFKNTALILIDLQNGILSMDTAPHSTETVLNNAERLIQKFRDNDGFIAFVRVNFHDGKDALNPKLAEKQLPGKPGKDFSEFPERFKMTEQDYIVNKRGFSAFFGTDLDLQLRRRGIDNIIIGGISTHMGVDTTARDAYQYGYEQYFVEDMMAAPQTELHHFSVQNSFPLMGTITTTDALLR